MSRHEGVSCDSCLKSNFSGLRYKCLICYDYDLCATCYNSGAASSSHSTDHAMQCILTRTDLNLYYGGDSTVTSQPQSYTCSYCGRMGFTVVLLQEHIRANHGDVLSTEVVCPVCAAHPGGDPNHVTDDLATHIALVHRSGTEFDDDQLSGIRQIRRLTHPVRASNFGSRPTRGPVMQLIEPPTTGMSPTGRDVMDPIAELLSQLTNVRSRATIAQGMTLHLQQIEMHLASAKMSQRQTDSTKSGSTSHSRSTAAENQSAAAAAAKPTSASSSGSSTNNSCTQFLLVRCVEKSASESEKQKQEIENADKSLFIQELLLSSVMESCGKEQTMLPPQSPFVKHPENFSSAPTELVDTTHSDTIHLVNGESISKMHSAPIKSCGPCQTTKDRIWDLSDSENCISPEGDSSTEDDVNSGKEENIESESAVSALSKESRLL